MKKTKSVVKNNQNYDPYSTYSDYNLEVNTNEDLEEVLLGVKSFCKTSKNYFNSCYTSHHDDYGEYDEH
jgi:hypothetical protein